MTVTRILLQDSNAYRIISGDKKDGALSHAYMFIHPDKDMLSAYLKELAYLIAAGDDETKNQRTYRLIKNETHSDVLFFPKEKEAISSEDVTALIEESFIKPIEGDKKIFVLNHAETMTPSAQNKLLKTLEEPPKNVYIILGATTPFNVLPTVLSRVKKLELPYFTDEQLFNALKEEYIDEERLKSAILRADGTLSKVKDVYYDKDLKKINDLVFRVLSEMNSSSDLLKYSRLIPAEDKELDDFLSELELVMRDLLVIYQGEKEKVRDKSTIEKAASLKGFNTGSVIYVLERITEARKRKKFNSKGAMLLEWLLFQILYGKFKWQKL